MEDRIFGNLVFDKGWTKKEKLDLWGKEVDVKIIISAYEDEAPNEAQQDAYIRLKKDLKSISKITLKKLKQYMEESKDDILLYAEVNELPENVFELVSISEILFVESGSFGIMCDAKWDSHGIAVLCKETEVLVGTQDIVWLEG